MAFARFVLKTILSVLFRNNVWLATKIKYFLMEHVCAKMDLQKNSTEFVFLAVRSQTHL
jgi:hypothetical protein